MENHLKGKKLIVSLTAGADKDYYQDDISFTIETLMKTQFDSICDLCNMDYTGYVFSGGYNPLKQNTEETIEKTKKHSKELVDKIKSLM